MRKNLIFASIIFGLFIFLSGCIGEQPTCNTPYILVGTECCLDANDNAICDEDEMQPVLNDTESTVNGSQMPVVGNDTDETIVVTVNDTPETPEPDTGPLCKPPYYEYMAGNCCLDTNDNLICDSDEITPPEVQTNETQETGNETETTPPDSNNQTTDAAPFKGLIRPEIKLISFCGDGFCAENENYTNCCIDCASCPTGTFCSNNVCTSSFQLKPLVMIQVSPERQITTDTVTDIAKPRISDSFVAWNEYFSGDSDIMLYNLQTSTIERIETPSTQYHPDVSAKRLVWTDYRRPVAGDNSDVYYYDLVSGTEGFVTSRIEYKDSAAIDGNYVVWVEQSGSKKYIYLHGLVSSTETKLTSSNIYPGGVDVSGTHVVYGHFNCDSGPCNYGIKLYDIISKTTTTIISTSGDINYYNVRIYGNKVVYISGKDAFTQVNVYDIPSKLTTQITSTSGEKNYPSIYQNTVVWQDKRNGNWDIYAYDLVKKKETQLTSEVHDQLFPDVYGNKVVYQDKRSGRHIYMYTLSS